MLQKLTAMFDPYRVDALLHPVDGGAYRGTVALPPVITQLNDPQPIQGNERFLRKGDH